MKKYLSFFILIFFIGFILQPLQSQSFIDKLKKKSEDKAIDKIFGNDKKSGKGTSREYGSDKSGSPSNTRGGGLNATQIDVNQNIGDAKSAFNSQNYRESRYSVRQAILGIELEIGENILNDLPASINALSAVPDEDNVTSTGIGFVGLIIQRVYRGEDQELRFTIGNDAAMVSAANMYLASGSYASSSQDENVKQTKFQDERAVIEYSESSGYKLSVPFGQSSILIAEGVNFSSEDEFMNASNNISLSLIKNQLGEK